MAEFDQEGTYAASEIVREADKALYQSKEHGRNRVTARRPPRAEPPRPSVIVVLERSISDGDKERVRAFLAERGFTVREIVGEQETILGAVGIVPVDVREVELLPGVARVIPITSPYKLASREFRREDSVDRRGPGAASAGRASW